LLCSDGLSRYAKESDIVEVVCLATNLEKACEGLIELAKAGNSDDNITCLLMRAEEQSWSERLVDRLTGGSHSTRQSSF
jgi:serine/threonine protein phosphatase PrpC